MTIKKSAALLLVCLLATAAAPPPVAAQKVSFKEIRTKGYEEIRGPLGWAVLKPKLGLVLAYDRTRPEGPGPFNPWRMLVTAFKIRPAGGTSRPLTLTPEGRETHAAAMAWEGGTNATARGATRKGIVVMADTEYEAEPDPVDQTIVLRAGQLKRNGKVKKIRPVMTFEAAGFEENKLSRRIGLAADARDGMTGVALGFSRAGKAELRLLELNARGQQVGDTVVLSIPGAPDDVLFLPLAVRATDEGWVVTADRRGLNDDPEPLLAAWTVPYGSGSAARAALVTPTILDREKAPKNAVLVRHELADVGAWAAADPGVFHVRATTWPQDYARSRNQGARQLELAVSSLLSGSARPSVQAISVEPWAQVPTWWSASPQASVVNQETPALGTTPNGTTLLILARGGFYNVPGRSWIDRRQEYSVYRVQANGSTELLYRTTRTGMLLTTGQIQIRQFGGSTVALVYMQSFLTERALYMLRFEE